jgi:hypothetical protein
VAFFFWRNIAAVAVEMRGWGQQGCGYKIRQSEKPIPPDTAVADTRKVEAEALHNPKGETVVDLSSDGEKEEQSHGDWEVDEVESVSEADAEPNTEAEPQSRSAAAAVAERSRSKSQEPRAKRRPKRGAAGAATVEKGTRDVGQKKWIVGDVRRTL